MGQALDNTTGQQVARLRGRLDEDEYARQMYCLGMTYNKALIGIEINFSTHPVKELDRLDYPNQYVREMTDTYTGKLKKAYGWKTDPITRPDLIANLKEVARDHLELIQDEETLKEMLSFAKNERGRPEALPGKHDDTVMALGIAHKIRGQESMTVKQAPAVKQEKLITKLKGRDIKRGRR